MRSVFSLLLGSLLLLMACAPGALSSSLQMSEDNAPLFLFVLNASKAYTRGLDRDGSQMQLQIPREAIGFVQMYSNRSGEVFTEFHQPGVKNLWKSVSVNLKHPAKATFSIP